MLDALKRIALELPVDVLNCARVSGVATSAQWVGSLVRHAGECGKSRNLSPADVAMGDGPFLVQRKHARAVISGGFRLIREIWYRDVYLKDDFLQIAPDATVVDLGAHSGVFTLLALAHGPNVRVVSVEPNRDSNVRFEHNVALNGGQDRVQLLRAFVGGNSSVQQLLSQRPEYAGAEFPTQEELLDAYGLTKIDFLKCDIEGSEFELLHEQSPLLARTRQLAIEVHDVVGDRREFLRRLERCGFEIGPVRHSPGDCVALARRVREQSV
jgi:FkbM family methyltransferase